VAEPAWSAASLARPMRSAPVERCLACEAVVSRVMRYSGPFLSLRSIAEVCSIDFYYRISQACGAQRPVSIARERSTDKNILCRFPWSPRPRKRGSAPRAPGING
jgi:hypothetical protein